MTQNLIILTGASRGMGLALAEQLLSPHATLLCISRHANTALADLARDKGCALTQWTQDLAEPVAAAARLSTWLATQVPAQFSSATLINNAGVIPALVPLGQSDPADLAHALRVGLEAPMLLCAAFLGGTQDWLGPRKVLNVSSGLGRRAMASSAAYCAAKAGMDHFTRCMALDEAHKPNGALVCALAPGVIDTDMQVQLRQADAAQFPDLRNFEGLYTQGQLTSPQEAAARLLAYLGRADFGELPVADVRA